MKKLNWIEITALYIGVIMGAGFASGRECWQFFGVFGSKGYWGAILITIGFVSYACMLTYIARSKNSAELGKLISPVDNKKIENILGITLALIYWSLVIAMTAAGGSLLNQQFGISNIWGGLIIAALIIFTVLGDFERLSGIFRYLVPILFGITVLTIILIISSDFSQSGETVFEPGAITPNWIVSSIVFVAYNSLGMITMAGNSAINAKDDRNAYAGAIAGTVFLGCLIASELVAVTSDMAFTAELSLPMLGYSLRISEVLNMVFAIVLYGAVYSTGSSIYYGFSTKLPDNRYKKLILIAGVAAGFGLGLGGFSKVVEFLYPVQGYLGMLFLLLIAINFFNEVKKNRSVKMQKTGRNNFS